MSHENQIESIRALRQQAAATVEAVEQRLGQLGPWGTRTRRARHLLEQARQILIVDDPSLLVDRIGGEDQGGGKPPVNDPGGSQVRPMRPTFRAEEAIVLLLATAAQSVRWLEIDRAYHAGRRVREAGELLLARQSRPSRQAGVEALSQEELIHWQSELQVTLATMQR